MSGLMFIKTENSQKLEKFLEKKNVNYEIYHRRKEFKKISEAELGKAYQEAWSNPQRYQEAQQWEKAAVSDWAERTKKDKK